MIKFLDSYRTKSDSTLWLKQYYLTAVVKSIYRQFISYSHLKSRSLLQRDKLTQKLQLLWNVQADKKKHSHVPVLFSSNFMQRKKLQSALFSTLTRSKTNTLWQWLCSNVYLFCIKL